LIAQLRPFLILTWFQLLRAVKSSMLTKPAGIIAINWCKQCVVNNLSYSEFLNVCEFIKRKHFGNCSCSLFRTYLHQKLLR